MRGKEIPSFLPLSQSQDSQDSLSNDCCMHLAQGENQEKDYFFF